MHGMECIDNREIEKQIELIGKRLTLIEDVIGMAKEVRKEEGKRNICPACERFICYDNGYAYGAKNCENCGQRLKW